jgi:HEAT repeat protein
MSDAHATRLVVLVVLAVVVAGFGTWLLLRRAEPAYNGKSLTVWDQQYGSNHWSGRTELAGEAEFAVRQIGSNAIPFLLKLMRAEDSNLKKKLRNHLPKKWHDALHLNDNSGKVRRMGAHGLAALGTNAPAAVPALIDLARNHPEEDGRYIAVFALRTLGPAAEAAIPFYFQCLTNSDPTIRNEAAVGLIRIPQQWQRTVPPLLRYFESIPDNITWEIRHGVELMGILGTNAAPVSAALLSRLDDERKEIREAVTNALPQIDPETADKAGIKRSQ